MTRAVLLIVVPGGTHHPQVGMSRIIKRAHTTCMSVRNVAMSVEISAEKPINPPVFYSSRQVLVQLVCISWFASVP